MTDDRSARRAGSLPITRVTARMRARNARFASSTAALFATARLSHTRGVPPSGPVDWVAAAVVRTMEVMSATAASPSFDSQHFRAVLGHFPTGVTVVTGLVDGAPYGFTIGSFTSISLDPPLVGFFAQSDSETWAAMAPYGKYCVNVLRDSQADLCWRFAKSGVGDDRFEGLTWQSSPTGCPIIDGVGAWIDCEIDQSIELGDHFLVVGRVVGLDHHAEPPEPLVFYRGELGGFTGSS